MNKYHLLALISLILGIIILGYSAHLGESEVLWILIIPVFIGHGIYSFIGFICIILAIFIGIYGFYRAGVIVSGAELFDEWQGEEDERHKLPSRSPSSTTGRPPPPSRPKIHGGGVILIGPIPIIFGSDKKTAIILSILAIIIMIIAIVGILGGLFVVK